MFRLVLDIIINVKTEHICADKVAQVQSLKFIEAHMLQEHYQRPDLQEKIIVVVAVVKSFQYSCLQQQSYPKLPQPMGVPPPHVKKK